MFNSLCQCIKHFVCKSNQFSSDTSFTALSLVAEKENYFFAILYDKFYQLEIYLIYISTHTYKNN